MAMTKLTLSAEKDLINLAKKQAREDGISVSAMFAGFIRARSQRKKQKPLMPGLLTRKALKIGKQVSQSISRQSDKELLEAALAEKYEIDL